MPLENKPRSESPLKLELLIAFFVLLAVGYVIFQQATLSQQIADSEARIDMLQRDISAIQTAQMQKTPSGVGPPTLVPSGAVPTASMPVLPSQPTPAVNLKISLPPKDSTLCRDDLFNFSWKADPSQIDEILILVSSSMFPGGMIFDGPLSYNETGAIGSGSIDWKIGYGNGGVMNLPDGDLYHIEVTALSKGNLVTRKQSDIFSINTCKG